MPLYISLSITRPSADVNRHGPFSPPPQDTEEKGTEDGRERRNERPHPPLQSSRLRESTIKNNSSSTEVSTSLLYGSYFLSYTHIRQTGLPSLIQYVVK